MYERHTYGTPQRKFTTVLPIGVMLLSMAVIAAYLLVGGALVAGIAGSPAKGLPSLRSLSCLLEPVSQRGPLLLQLVRYTHSRLRYHRSQGSLNAISGLVVFAT